VTSERAARFVVAFVALLLVACSGGGGSAFALDGSPRVADDEGVVTGVSEESITLDGERTYGFDRDLVSFSSIDLSPLPLINTKHQYVQVGIDDGNVTWIGAVARPVLSDPPAVVYVGEVEGVEAGRLTFTNGTVFRLDDGVDADGLGGLRAQISLDPEEGVVTEVQT
jgi:hypothetical protein